ncbi:MAG TPA: hypothetical protein VLL76_11780 [Candidatus Omnitrophota bacterium]|nr:hypothetical protein [Candidatus Omnitrophota bacterium]
MARNGNEEKVRLLRAVAFHIHKKMPAAEALNACFEAEGRGGRHRQWRQAGAVLEAEGFVPALLAAELVGEEAATVLTVLESAGDHRLLSNALNALAEYCERQ